MATRNRWLRLALASCALVVRHDSPFVLHGEPPPETGAEIETAAPATVALALAELVPPIVSPAIPPALAAAITGVVRDPIAGVIPGADVHAVRDGAPFASTSCDRAGRFRLLLSAGPVVLEVDAQGYVTRHVDTFAPNRLDILLSPESVVRGRVLTAKNRAPLPHLLVALVKSDRRVPTAGLTESSALTNDDGAFELGGVEPGLHDIEVRSDAWVAAASGPIAVPFAEDVSDVEVLVQPALSFTGRVLSDDDDFCARGSIDVVEEQIGFKQRVEFSAGAEVVLGGLIAGGYRISVTCAEGLVTTYPPVALRASIADLEWPVARGQSIVGRVFDLAYDPVAGIEVRLSSFGKEGPHAVTGRDGSFEIVGLKNGTHRITVHGADEVEPSQVFVPHLQLLELVIDRPGRLRGRLVSRELEPLAYFDVNIAGFETTTDAGGRFLFPEVPPGTQVLSAGHPERTNREEGEASRHSIIIEPGETTTATVVEMISLGKITGVAIDEDGFPAAGVIVSALRLGDQADPRSKPVEMRLDRSVSDMDGRFALSGLPDGAYVVIGQAPGRSEARQRSLTGDDLRLEVAPVARVLGYVQYEDGSRPASIRVLVVSERHVADDVFYNEDAAFSFSDLPFGTYEIFVETKDGRGHALLTAEERLVRLAEPITLTAVSGSLRR